MHVYFLSLSPLLYMHFCDAFCYYWTPSSHRHVFSSHNKKLPTSLSLTLSYFLDSNLKEKHFYCILTLLARFLQLSSLWFTFTHIFFVTIRKEQSKKSIIFDRSRKGRFWTVQTKRRENEFLTQHFPKLETENFDDHVFKYLTTKVVKKWKSNFFNQLTNTNYEYANFVVEKAKGKVFCFLKE